MFMFIVVDEIRKGYYFICCVALGDVPVTRYRSERLRLINGSCYVSSLIDLLVVVGA